MTVFAAVQSAAIRLSQQKPISVFADQTTFTAEMGELATETAVSIAKEYDWRVLTKLGTLTGDASSTEFSLPPDYDRMPLKAALHSNAFLTATFRQARDLDEWLFIKDNVPSGVPGNWVILGGKMQIFPAMPASQTARFYYISKSIISNDGTPKSAFDKDSDVFALPERLLVLGLIWRWRAQKRLEYAEDMRNFEIALSQEILRDKGSSVITVGRRRYPGNVHEAYPGNLG